MTYDKNNEKQIEREENNMHCVWESNVIFIGYKNIDEQQYREIADLAEILKVKLITILISTNQYIN